MLRSLVTIWLAVFVLSACEPEATPLPVDIVPTTASATAAASPQTIRYAIEPSALLVISPHDYDLLSGNGEIVPVTPPFHPDDLGAQYNVLIALGDLPNGTQTPMSVTISLGLNTTLPPLDDPAIADIVRRCIETTQFATALALPGAEALPNDSESPQALRTALANLGLPDGFDLNLAALAAPGAEAAAAQLAAITVDTHIDEFTHDDTPDLSRYHLVLLTNASETSISGIEQDSILPLATIPISYQAAEGVTVEFTSGGFPLVR